MRDIETIIKEADIWKNAKNITHEGIHFGVNHTYKVNADGVLYALRIDGEQKDYVSLSKSEEVKAVQKAAELGFGPKVFSTQENSDYLITEFIQGNYINIDQMHDPVYMKAIAETLLKVHKISDVSRDCSPFYMLDKYLEGIRLLHFQMPEDYLEMLKKVPEIEKRCLKNSKYTKKYCHNDFFTFNMISTDNNIFVIDWELSGMGDIFFDLSTISFSGLYSEIEDEELLKNYFGYFEDEQKILLNNMKYINMLRDIAFLLLHAAMDASWTWCYNTAVKSIKDVQKGHLHFRCNCN